MPPSVQLAIALAAMLGVGVLVNGVTGSATFSWLCAVGTFAFFLVKGDDIFKSPNQKDR